MLHKGKRVGSVQIFILQFGKCEGKFLRLFALQSKTLGIFIGFMAVLSLVSVGGILPRGLSHGVWAREPISPSVIRAAHLGAQLCRRY